MIPDCEFWMQCNMEIDILNTLRTRVQTIIFYATLLFSCLCITLFALHLIDLHIILEMYTCIIFLLHENARAICDFVWSVNVRRPNMYNDYVCHCCLKSLCFSVLLIQLATFYAFNLGCAMCNVQNIKCAKKKEEKRKNPTKKEEKEDEKQKRKLKETRSNRIVCIIVFLLPLCHECGETIFTHVCVCVHKP